MVPVDAVGPEKVSMWAMRMGGCCAQASSALQPSTAAMQVVRKRRMRMSPVIA